MSTFLKIVCSAVALILAVFLGFSAIQKYSEHGISGSVQKCFYIKTIWTCIGKMHY